MWNQFARATVVGGYAGYLGSMHNLSRRRAMRQRGESATIKMASAVTRVRTA